MYPPQLGSPRGYQAGAFRRCIRCDQTLTFDGPLRLGCGLDIICKADICILLSQSNGPLTRNAVPWIEAEPRQNVSVPQTGRLDARQCVAVAIAAVQLAFGRLSIKVRHLQAKGTPSGERCQRYFRVLDFGIQKAPVALRRTGQSLFTSVQDHGCSQGTSNSSEQFWVRTWVPSEAGELLSSQF